MSDEIKRMFKKDRERQAAKREAREREEEAYSRAREQVAHVLETEVRPALESVAKQIVEEGHKASVAGVPDSNLSSWPFVQLLVEYEREGGPTVTSGSWMKISMAGTSAVKVETKIWAPRPGDDSRNYRPPEGSPVPLRDVNSDWARQQALRFLSQVIDAWNED